MTEPKYDYLQCSCGKRFGNTKEEVGKSFKHLQENVSHLITPKKKGNNMAEPKLIKKEVIYYEMQEKYMVEIKGKQVEVQKYQKQDPQFNDYEMEIRVLDKDKILTEDENEQVYEFVECEEE